MEALLHRIRVMASAGVLLVGVIGCGLFAREVDQKVEETLSDPSLPVPRKRAQAPPPLELPPSQPKAPTEPIPKAGGSKIVPLDLPPSDTLPSTVPTPTVSETVLKPVSNITAQPLPDRMNATPVTQVKVVATIGADIIITDEEVSMMMKQRARDYIQLKGEERTQKEKEVYREELKKLIERELLLNDFLTKVKKNKPQLIDELWERSAKMSDDHFRALKKLFNIKNEDEFTAELEKQGLSYKLFRRQVERESMVTQFVGSLLREKNGTPTVAEVQAYYDQHHDDFKTLDKVKFLHLFVSHARFDSKAESQKYAEGLWTLARNGGDFVKIVKENGHGDSPLRDGAGIGETRGEIQPAELEETVFNLKAGNISGVIPAENGFHVVKVLSREVAGHKAFDEKLQSEIRNKLMNMAMKSERDKIVTTLWRQTGVTILNP